MRRSQDLRKRVIVFVRGGGSTTEAARRFQVSRASGYNWTSVPDGLVYRRPGPRGPRRLDWEALRSDVATHPDRTQKERHALIPDDETPEAVLTCPGPSAP